MSQVMCRTKRRTSRLTGLAVGVLSISAGHATAQQPFTIVAMPDTQKYTETTAWMRHFNAQTNWIRDHINAGNQRNIQFVALLGDITENATPQE